MMRNSIKVKKNSLYFLMLTAFVATVAYCMKSPTTCLIVVLLQLGAILWTAKVSLFSVFAVLVNFCLVQQYAAYVGIEVYGLLEITDVPIYYYEMFVCTYVFNAILHLVLSNSASLENEADLFKEKLDVGFDFSIILSVAAVIITLLIFPSIPSLVSFSSIGRFNGGILSFSGWSCIPYFFLSVSLINHKSTRFVVPMAIFVSAWYIFHGERVDCIGFLTLFAVKYFNEHPGKKAIIKELTCALIVGIVFVGVGSLRGGTSNVKLSDLLHGLLIQSTACDVTYVFNCAVDLAKNNNLFRGITYLSYVVNCVPLLKDPYSFQSCIHEYYFTAGGGHFFAEPIANFGLGFAWLFSCIYIVFLVWVVRKKSRYHYMVYAAISITIFRSAWYGLNYPITTILYFAPAVLIGYDLVFSEKRRK